MTHSFPTRRSSYLVGNPATNVIPSEAKARISIRFNDRHSGAELVERIRVIVESEGGELLAKISGEPFLTPHGEFSDMIDGAITQATGLGTEISTSGGTYAARLQHGRASARERGCP